MNVERYFSRDLHFSKWHRTLSDQCTMIDIDVVEHCRYCKTPLILMELKRDVGQAKQPSSITRKIAELCGCKGLLVYYKLDLNKIIGFKVWRIHPEPCEARQYTPEQFSQGIVMAHEEHNKECHRV